MFSLSLQCRERVFNLRYRWTIEQSRLYSGLGEEKGSNDKEDKEWRQGEMDECREEQDESKECRESEAGKSSEEGEDGEFSEEEEEEGDNAVGSRRKKECPLPICNAKVFHLPRHMRECHSWSRQHAGTVTSRFNLRKKYTFSNKEMVSSGNRKKRKVHQECELKTKKPRRKTKLCPIPGCSTKTERLPQHLQKTHRLKRDDARYTKLMSLAKVVSREPHVFQKMEKERRKNLNVSHASSLSQDEDVEKGSDNAGDAIPLQSNMDDEEEVYHESHEKAHDSERSSEDDITGSATLATKVLNEFRKWLLSPDGEKKDMKTAKQHVAQLKNVLSIVGGGTRLESLVDAKTIRDVFLGEHAKEKYCPATIKSYLTSLQHYCSFLLGDRPSGVVFNTEEVIRLRDQFKRWSASYKRDNSRRRWERHEEEVNSLITPEKINEFNKSKASRDAVIILGELCGDAAVELNQAKYTLVRNYLIVQIMIDNANRAGVVSNMTMQEFQRATVEDDRYIVRVLDHKTVDTHGPARVILTKHLHNYIAVFIKGMRSQLPDSQLETKQTLFVTWSGKQMESTQMTSALSSIFKRAGIEGPVHHTLYRKSAVSQCHANHKEISGNLADLMAHREETATKYYRVFEKNKSSVKASQKLHAVMRNCEANDKGERTEKALDESQSNESEHIAASSPVIVRSPWKEESVKALCDVFAEEISAQQITITSVREKIQSHPILSKEDPKRVLDRIRAEWRYNTAQTVSNIGEVAALPTEKESVATRVDRLFQETSSLSSDIVACTDTTERSKGLFNEEQAKSLKNMFHDMINNGAPISRPVIATRLAQQDLGKTLFKNFTANQVVSRLKYERRLRQCHKKLGDC